MKRCLKFGIYVLGTIAMMYMAFMLPILLSGVSVTWSHFTARAESSPITIKTGMWEDDEPITDDDDDEDDNIEDHDDDNDENNDENNNEDNDEDNDDQGNVQVDEDELNLLLQTDDYTNDVSVIAPDQTIATEGQAPDQTTDAEGMSNEGNTITTE